MRSKIRCKIVCEKPRSQPIRTIIDDFHKRISWLEIIYVKDVQKSLEKYDNIVLLDEKGAELSSTGFAVFCEQQPRTFVIGPAQGFSDAIKKKYPALRLSLLTFPHEIVALLLVEQIYRAHTIIEKIPYHKS
jgi:23S rRNA pseudoU1915 N3-methylase RlmH